jgi:hypothetical protein
MLACSTMLAGAGMLLGGARLLHETSLYNVSGSTSQESLPMAATVPVPTH